MSSFWYAAIEICSEIGRWCRTTPKERALLVGGAGIVGVFLLLKIVLGLWGVLFDSVHANAGYVTGTVAVGGVPVAGVQVRFEPVSGGMASHGLTDSSGRYDLQAGSRQRGTVVGRHIVRLTTATLVQGPSGGEEFAIVNETIADRYNVDSELVVEVLEGQNKFDWNLEIK